MSIDILSLTSNGNLTFMHHVVLENTLRENNILLLTFVYLSLFIFLYNAIHKVKISALYLGCFGLKNPKYWPLRLGLPIVPLG